MPMITCVMPAYNEEKYMTEAIESVLGQTYKDFEFIIIDDGSSDDTPKIIEDYANKDDRIIYLANEENKGASYTRNRGLAAANGKYIAVMNADDLADASRFEKQAAYLDENEEIGALGSSYFVFKEDDKKNGQVYGKPADDHDIRVHALYESPIENSTLMMRKSVIDEHNLRYNEEYDGAEGYEFLHRMKNYTKFHNLKDVLAGCRFKERDIKTHRLNFKIINEGLKEIVAEDFHIPLFENPEDIAPHFVKESFRVISEIALMRLKEDCPFTRSELATVATEQRAYIFDSGILSMEE